MLNKEKKHLKVLLSSIKKIYNKAVINGKLEIKELYYLNVIFNIVNKLELTFEQTKTLESYYNKLSHYSDNICKPDMIKTYYTPKRKFVQATKKHCDNEPLPDYNEKDCSYLLYIESASGGTEFQPLPITYSYTTCSNIQGSGTFIFGENGEGTDEVLEINECIQNNTLIVNGILITNYSENIEIDLNPEFNYGWTIRFGVEACPLPS